MDAPEIDRPSLPLNFPQSFLPERRLLARLLPFAAAGGSGDKVRIGEETGIPTGESTGKVEPMIHYARGMGLIYATKSASRWQLSLTALGRCVLAQDPYLSEAVTLWLIHLMLCRRNGLSDPPLGIADPWFALFAEGDLRLGQRFAQTAYLDYLIERHGAKGYIKGLAGLVLRGYLEPACLGSAEILCADLSAGPAVYLRRPAPTDRSYFPAYSAYLFLLWDALYPGHDQLALDELFSASRCLALLGWERETAARWLDWMADRGLLQLDRQTGGILAMRLRDPRTVIAGIYDALM